MTHLANDPTAWWEKEHSDRCNIMVLGAEPLMVGGDCTCDAGQVQGLPPEKVSPPGVPVSDARLIWWCEEHGYSGYKDACLYPWWYAKESFANLEDSKASCRMVQRPLFDYDEGVEINWCVPHARGGYLVDGIIQCDSIIYSPCLGIQAVVFPLPSSRSGQ